MELLSRLWTQPCGSVWSQPSVDQLASCHVSVLRARERVCMCGVHH